MRITFDGGSDHQFRSNLERDVAAEMDRLHVEWRYEVRVTLPDGQQPRYLPDFTIDGAPDGLGLREWVECKPQQMLYELRDTLGVTRRAGEHFKTDVHVEGATAAVLQSYGVEELWKPKMLAEMTGGEVLVLGKVGGTSSLSVTMCADDIIFSRYHPFVNQHGHVRRAEREAQRSRWAAEEEQRTARWNLEQEEVRRHDAEVRRSNVRNFVANLKPINPQFASACHGCRRHGADGGVYRVRFSDNTERWERVCAACQAGAKW